MQICVLGLGYIGLPTAALLAAEGFPVLGVEVDLKLLTKLRQGEIHIEEPQLIHIVKKAIQAGHLRFASQPAGADVFIIAVPTPCTTANACDLSYLIKAVQDIIPVLAAGNMIIVESTVPPLTCEEYVKPLLEAQGLAVGKDICLVHCPERVLPGRIIAELVLNDRIIGGCNPECAQAAAAVYAKLVKGEIFLTDLKTAEMTKLVENTYRDVNIALVNELAIICRQLGINVLDVIRLANKHPRVQLLQPGPGVGGHCLAVDPYFIIEKAPASGRLISRAREVNALMPQYIVSLVKNLLQGISPARVAVFGLTYKGNINDLRESPALEIVRRLRQQKVEVALFDPHVTGLDVYSDPAAAVRESDMILILCDHREFQALDYDSLAKAMRNPLIFDTKNILSPEDFISSEIRLYSLGGWLA